MKIDTHVHSSGISKCSRISYEGITEEKLKAGYNGVVLMNHCQPWYYEPENFAEWIESFIAEFQNAYKYGKERGFTFFLGIEVSIKDPRWTDFLLFGVTEEFLRNAPDLCRINQQELYEYCQKYGVLMVQAHPQRETFEFLDPKYMDGVEVNCQPRDIFTRKTVEEFAKKHNLLITVGTDYHIPYDGDIGGIVIPDNIENSVELCNYLKQTNQIEAFIKDEAIIYYKKTKS